MSIINSGYKCGSKTFTNFIDGHKFKYTNDGNIAFNYDNSTWKNVLLNNMLLEDYLHSQYMIPIIKINPVYDMNLKNKIKKYQYHDQIIDNYKYKYMINKKFYKKINNVNNINNFKYANKHRLSRKKNIDKTKKYTRLNKIFNNDINDVDNIIWLKCYICSQSVNYNYYNLCFKCDYNFEYIYNLYDCCPACGILNETGDICVFCRLYD